MRSWFPALAGPGQTIDPQSTAAITKLETLRPKLDVLSTLIKENQEAVDMDAIHRRPFFGPV